MRALVPQCVFADLHFGWIDRCWLYRRRRSEAATAEVNVRGLYYEDLHFFYQAIYLSIVYISVFVFIVYCCGMFKVTDDAEVVLQMSII